MLRDLVLSLSLANLFFLSLWVEVQQVHSHVMDYYRKTPAGWTFAGATLFGELLLAGCFWIAIILVRRTRNKKLMTGAQCVFLGLLVIVLGTIRRTAFELIEPMQLMVAVKLSLMTLEILFSVGIVLHTVIRRCMILRFGIGLVSFLSPLPLIIVAHLIWINSSPSVFSDKMPTQSVPSRQSSGVRVACVIFDELDQYISFVKRPAGITMPEFDRLSRETIRGSQVFPAADMTMEALPSMVTGHGVTQAKPTGASELRLRYRGDNRIEAWHDSPSIFSRARDLGFTTSLVGWYHPYGRVLGGSLSYCYWEPNEDATPLLLTQAYFEHIGLLASIPKQIARLGDLISSGWNRNFKRNLSQTREQLEFLREREKAQYLRLRQYAIQELCDPGRGFVFVHLPVPHPLGIFDRSRHEISTKADSNYLDNLELADVTLGEIRRAMEGVGIWDRTTLLITSDHPLRPETWNYRPTWTEEEESICGTKHSFVPFFVKMAGVTAELNCEAPLNSVLVHDLTLALLTGELSRAESVKEWLERHRSAMPIQ